MAASVLAIGSILPGGAFAQGMTERAALRKTQVSSPEARLTLRVYNYAEVAPEVLERAERVTEALLEEGGIAITWMDCTPHREEFLPDPVCPSEMGASDLVLRLLPRRMGMKLAAPKEPLGFAQPCPETEPACELTVLYFRVEELAAEGHRPELILGHVMAHEVAHLLIGPGHSEGGIMRREWSQEELRRMSLGLRLSFTSEQSRRLQNALLRRIKQPTPETSTRADLVAAPSQLRK